VIVDSKQGPVASIDQSLSIFEQDWWLHIARGSSHYHELRVFDGDVVVGKLPYILMPTRIGFFLAKNPHWSRLGGPVVSERLSRKEQAEVLQLLVQQLPRWSSADFVCNSNTSYADLVRSAFKSAGFEHTTQVNYVRDPDDADLMQVRKSKHNGHIRRAGKELDCVEISANEFVRIYEMNLKARGKRSYSPLDIAVRLIEESVSKGQARAIAAKPKCLGNRSTDNDLPSNLYDAAVAYVWDRSRCYYWLAANRIASADDCSPKPQPDAIKVLAVLAMQHARDMKIVFDVDGVTTPGTQNLYHNMFGLRKKEHRDIFTRTTSLERIYQKYRSQIKEMISLTRQPGSGKHREF
jgi:hypothetical protein